MRFNLEQIRQSWITPFIAILAGFYAFYHTVLKSDLERTGIDLVNRFKQQEIEIQKKKFDTELMMNVYNEVKEAVNDTNKNNKYMLSVLINQIYSLDTTGFGKSMTDALLNDPNFPVKKINMVAHAEEFNEVERNTQKEIIKDSLIRKETGIHGVFTKVDIFYLESCEDSNSCKKTAEIIAGTLTKKSYKVRVRMLPIIINNRAGYRVQQNEIRFGTNDKGEIEIARNLQNELSGYAFELHPVSFRTPGYISIFIK